MKRNFNFCKGLDVYDGGVSEYYIKFRNTWYRYLKLTLMRHRISLKKLQAFSCDMKNEMIIAALETNKISHNLQIMLRSHLCFKKIY